MANQPATSVRNLSRTTATNSLELQAGTICQYQPRAGFGYVQDATRKHTYLFLVGKAIRHSDARGLHVGERVHFRVEAPGRVIELRRLG